MKTYTKYLDEAKPSKKIGMWGKYPAYVSGFKSLAKGKTDQGFELTLKDGSRINIVPETARVLYSFLDGPYIKDEESKGAFIRNLSKNKTLFNKMLKMAQKKIYG